MNPGDGLTRFRIDFHRVYIWARFAKDQRMFLVSFFFIYIFSSLRNFSGFRVESER